MQLMKIHPKAHQRHADAGFRHRLFPHFCSTICV
jgi:hypothetical protein